MTKLSVIVPTYNRAAILGKCVAALRAQDAPAGAFEIVVSDDGSKDGTRAVAEAAMREGGPRVRYLHQDNAGANRARNRAIAIAEGEVVLLINDDTIATAGMVRGHLEAHREHPDDRVAVLGRVTIAPQLPHSRLAALHLDRAFRLIGERRELDWRAFYTCNVSVKKALLERGGYFEERIRYHEDLELAERLSHHGLRVIYRPEALGYHDHYLTEEEFFSIAGREARALAQWARIAPQVAPQLGEFGYEPVLPLARRAKHRLLEIAINRATIPFWRRVARDCPARFEALAQRLYLAIYQCVKRGYLRRETVVSSTSGGEG
ncbi:MAG TPA: glycosyltransferase [Usitatibacter sp.]|jgi:glycosyltransferase involved in cell wall biosynthesis|nr:glycosyltransferase [Usitatibacter sp.]